MLNESQGLLDGLGLIGVRDDEYIIHLVKAFEVYPVVCVLGPVTSDSFSNILLCKGLCHLSGHSGLRWIRFDA